MRQSKVIFFILFTSILLFALLSKKEIIVSYQNSIRTEVLNTELYLDDKLVEREEVVFSSNYPIVISKVKANFGSHLIKLKCEKLNISKSVKIFTLYKNNVEFEFVGNAESGYEIIERNSWLSLEYE